MIIQVLNSNLACSTLCLGCIPGDDMPLNLTQFKARCRAACDFWESQMRGSGSLYQNHPKHCYVSNYSFVFASTREDQSTSREHFLSLGFQASPEVYNGKNGTKVVLFMLSVPEFLDAITEGDE